MIRLQVSVGARLSDALNEKTVLLLPYSLSAGPIKAIVGDVPSKPTEPVKEDDSKA